MVHVRAGSPIALSAALPSMLRAVLDRCLAVAYGPVHDLIVERFTPYRALEREVLRATPGPTLTCAMGGALSQDEYQRWNGKICRGLRQEVPGRHSGGGQKSAGGGQKLSGPATMENLLARC